MGKSGATLSRRRGLSLKSYNSGEVSTGLVIMLSFNRRSCG
jgi:hypothetical protein